MVIYEIIMIMIVGNSESFRKTSPFPEINEACTVSVPLADYIADDQKKFFKNRQWFAYEGLENTTLILGNELEIVNSEDNMG